MGIFNNIFSKNEKPTIRASGSDGLSFTYSTDFEVFYKVYEQNPYIETCIDKISNDIGKYGILLKRGKFEKDINILGDLVKYSLDLNIKTFIKRLWRDYEITGNAFVYIARTKSGRVEGLQILDPRYVKPIVSEQGQVMGYYQNLQGIRTFTKDEVFHLKGDQDTTNEAIGRSKMQSLFLDLESDKEAKESNWAFFANNQTPSSLVVLDQEFREPDEATLKKIKDLFQGGSNKGGKNKHRTSLIQGVKEVIKLQDKIEDAQFLNLRRFTLELVCARYGVPKDILGFTETSNRSVGENQTDNYWDMIEGYEKQLGEFLTSIISKIFPGEKYVVEFVQDNVRKLTKKSSIATDLYEKGVITRNEARDFIQYEKVDGEDTFKDTFSKTQNTAII